MDKIINIFKIEEMIKSEELMNPESCFQKADHDEMLFVLRAQDVSSPKIILLWLAENINNISNAKARGALECAIAMKHQQGRRPAD